MGPSPNAVFREPSVNHAFGKLQLDLDHYQTRLNRELTELKFLVDAGGSDYISSTTYLSTLVPKLPRYGGLLAYGLIESHIKDVVIGFLKFVRDLEVSSVALGPSLLKINEDPRNNDGKIRFENRAVDRRRGESCCATSMSGIILEAGMLQYMGNFRNDLVSDVVSSIGFSSDQWDRWQSDRNLLYFRATRDLTRSPQGESRGLEFPSHRRVVNSDIQCFPLNSERDLLLTPRANEIRHPLDWVVQMRNALAHGGDFSDAGEFKLNEVALNHIIDYCRLFSSEFKEFAIDQAWSGEWVSLQCKEEWDELALTLTIH